MRKTKKKQETPLRIFLTAFAPPLAALLIMITAIYNLGEHFKTNDAEFIAQERHLALIDAVSDCFDEAHSDYDKVRKRLEADGAPLNSGTVTAYANSASFECVYNKAIEHGATSK